MSFETGQMLAHYRLVEKIGEGGMGAVWRADDTTLGRQVAVKLLPPEVGADADRLARFEREARLLASLNHPNVASIYGLHEADDVRFLAMELVEGEDLGRRLARGPLPVKAALHLAGQVAEALEAAHDSGIVHRDLKPANVQLMSDGRIKVLDFGLARALHPEPLPAESASASPTVAAGATASGVILGTAAYMSPEQARGEVVDQRADVWAFGCLLFEMLSARRPFRGDSVTDLLAAVLRDEPDWDALPAETPPGARRLLRHCLAKDARRRLRHMGDARLLLEDAPGGAESGAGPGPARGAPPMRAALPWVAALVALGALVTLIAVLQGGVPPGSGAPTKVDLRLAGLETATNRWGTPPMALSPDGRLVAYLLQGTDGVPAIGVRSLDSYDVRALPGTEGGTQPFFSPDGAWIGFFAEGELRKVPASGQGAAQTLHRIEGPVSILGAAWTPGDTIIFGNADAGLLEVPARGGDAVAVTTPDPERGEVHHGFPVALPNGRNLLFVVFRGSYVQGSRLAVLSRATGAWRALFPSEQHRTQPHYLASGHLVYADGDRLLAAPFDPSTLELLRSPVVVVDDVQVDLGSGVSYFDVTADGSLLYLPAVRNRLVWVDRLGAVTPILDVAGEYLHPRLSPDGRKIALLSLKGVDTDVWVVDVERQGLERLTHGGDHAAPLWTPDGEAVTFLQDHSSIAMRRADGTGETEIILQDEREDRPMGWSPDGRTLAYETRTEGAALDIWAVVPGSGDPPRKLVGTEFSEESPRFSPDGRWLAFVSNHTGRYEVYVAPYPALDRRWQISTNGGSEPAWNPRGGELFYRAGRRMLSVPLSSDGAVLKVGRPLLLFEGSYNRSQLGHAHYDVAPDGRRFVMVEEDREAFQHLRMVLGWDRELRQLAAE